MTLQDSCDTLYKSTRKLVFEIEENRCAVTGAAATGWENKKYQPPDGDRYFLLGDGGFTPAGHKLRLHLSPQKNIPAGQTTVGNIWWGMVDLPLRGINFGLHLSPPKKYPRRSDDRREYLVGDGGFEPPKALPADLQSVPFGHSGNPPYSLGAGGRIRTPDLLITNQLLYQLSYTSISISAAYSNRTFGVCQHIFYARNEGE